MPEFTDRANELAAGVNTLGADADARVAQKDAEIADLKKQLEDATKPDPEPTPTPSGVRLGYCPDPNTPAEVTRLGAFNGANVRRSYQNGSFSANPTFAEDKAKGLQTAHTVKGPGGSMADSIRLAMSNKDRPVWKGYLRKLQEGSIAGAWHEPENDPIEKALWKSGQEWFSDLIHEINDEFGLGLKVAGNLMSSTDSVTEIRDWYPGEGVWDIMGFDGYNWPNRTPGNNNVPNWVEFEQIFTPDWQRCQELGVGFAIFEFGCRKANLYNDANNNNPPTPEMSAKQVDWCKKARSVMENKLKPVVACYFHHDWWLMRDEGHKALAKV